MITSIYGDGPLPGHGRFGYSPITRRPDYTWPNGARLAVYLGFNLEHFAFGGGLGARIGPASPEPDVLNYSWREYGNRVGAWRCLELFDQLALPAGCILNTALYEHCPELLAACAARGDELIGHGHTNSERQGDFAEGEEAALLAACHGHGHAPSPALDWRLQLHAWLALLAYATLALSTVLALFLWAQERALRRREFRPWLRALPPLADLETLLFRTITVGFCLLTLTLLTGVLFVDNLLEQKLVHKTVLSVLSWIVFGTLLIGRRRYGWRGIKAVHWTLTAMVLLLLAFFGSQFVIELVLGRA